MLGELSKGAMDDDRYVEGAKSAIPIVLGYLPVGLAFGVLARRAGMTSFEVGLMSLLVYAGSSQFVAVEMLSRGVTVLPIVVTTFFVNLRHLLMSSTLSLYFSKRSLRTLGLLSAQLTDESFAVALSNPSKMTNRPRYLFGLQMTSQLAWVGGSVAGALFGGVINHEGYGLPFAMPALFICLLVLQIKTRLHFWMMALAGVFSCLFKWVFPGNWYIVLTALVTSAIAVVIETSKGRRRGGASC
jgi:4-azaleucine resistance transporter AzlC